MFAVTPVNFLDDAFAAIAAGKVEVDIRPAFPAFAEETFEDQVVAHRIDRRDSQAITDGAVRRAAAALHHDVVFPAEINDVPDDQKIAGKPEPLDQAQLLLELPLHGRADGRVTLLRAKERDRPQERIHVVPLRHRKRGKLVADIFQGKFEPLSHARRVFDRIRAIVKEGAHFGLALQISFRVSAEQFSRGVEMRVLADAGENIENLPAVWTGVLHTIGRDNRQPVMFRQIDKVAG